MYNLLRGEDTSQCPQTPFGGESMIKGFVTKFRFMQDCCPYHYHWCNGKHIPDIDSKTGQDKSGFADSKPCEHCENGVCKHPLRKK